MSFVTWTSFEIPSSVLFTTGIPHRVAPEYDSRLTDTIRLILQAHEHVFSAWGRVVERPEKIILVSCKTRLVPLTCAELISISAWKCEDSFTAFKTTSEYLQYWTGLGDISSVTPIEQQIRPTFSWPGRLRGNIDIFSISLPSPVSEVTRAQLKELKDLQRAGGVRLGKMHLSPYTWQPTKVWITGTQEVDGKEVETMLYMCWWGNKKKEKDFKDYSKYGETRTRLENFELSARSVGASHIREEHCDFVHIAV